ncbi:MAG: biotin--[acetyl-CoA-carboxylase] ligase [Candidatus Coatesbacteria bacterium]|nr:biotin--[acetyl-CoA-carboxylase] ligase [Candidatus Coatesbacteria bacterium]
MFCSKINLLNGCDDEPRGIQTAPLRLSLKWYDEVTSTNEVAKELMGDEVEEGTVVIAKQQTAGRGRYANEWFSPEGGLYFTVALRPRITVRHIPLLAIAVALAIADSIELSMLSTTQIKWPNDIYVSGKKVGGVLIDTSISGEKINYALAGIGVNVSRGGEEVSPLVRKRAIWLSDLVGCAPQPTELLTAILGSFTTWYQRLQVMDLNAIIDAFNRRSLLMGREIQAQTKDGIVSGKCTGISEQGALLLRNSNGDVLEVMEGTICSWS